MNSGNPFFDHPILNSPYGYPERHWELDDQGQPTQKVIENRRLAEFITPIPKPKKRKGKQTSLERLTKPHFSSNPLNDSEHLYGEELSNGR